MIKKKSGIEKSEIREAKETYCVILRKHNQTIPPRIPTTKDQGGQKKIITPKVVETPLPPLNFKNTVHICPDIAAPAAAISNMLRFIFDCK